MKFLFLGGDLRTVKLIQLLNNSKHEIYIFGMEKMEEELEENIQKLSIDMLNISENMVVIAPIPFTKDGEKLNAPFSSKDINIKEILPLLKNKTLIAGSISEKMQQTFKNYQIQAIDIMENEELAIFNTIATAEGAIDIAISNTEYNIHGRKVLILGFGKVAKTLAYKLASLSVKVTCAARKQADLAWIETLGYKAENINYLDEKLNKYDIIINTVPQIILTKEKLKNVQKNTLIIDLASKPGGVDQEAIKTFDLKYIWALALPGKYAPLSSAMYIKKAIYNILNIDDK